MVIKHLFLVRLLFESSCTCVRFHRLYCGLASSSCVFEVSLGVFESLPASWFILIPHSGFRDTLENMCIVCNINQNCFLNDKTSLRAFWGGSLSQQWYLCSGNVEGRKMADSQQLCWLISMRKAHFCCDHEPSLSGPSHQYNSSVGTLSDVFRKLWRIICNRFQAFSTII